MMAETKTSVTYRVIQAGRVFFTGRHHQLVITGQLVGTIGDVACFDGIRWIDNHDRRRAADETPDTYRGPVTIDMVSDDGVIIGRIGLAWESDVASHPRGELAAAR